MGLETALGAQSLYTPEAAMRSAWLTKLCSGCSLIKPKSLFSVRQTGDKVGQVAYRCKVCLSEYGKKWYEKNVLKEQTAAGIRYREKGRAAKWLRRYGISEDDYYAMSAAQGGVCKICQRPPDREWLDIDHDHGTGKVRGLLCNCCNTSVGRMKESPSTFRRAALYIENGGDI